MVEQYRDPNQPIGVTIPLTGVPEPQTFAWLECELESCPYITVGFEAATEALGWELVVISSESANPGPAFQQAIDAGVDFIASTGEAPSLYEEQAQAAADAGIKILSCFDTTPPNGPETNIWTQCGDTSFVEKTGPLMANWAIVDSEGAANILIVSIPDFPVLKAETDAYIAELEANCPDCEYTELNITIPQLVGGEVPAAVASQLQANPDINYVFFSFGSLPAGVTASLESAGLADQVTVYGQDFSAFGLEEIVAGTMGAWSADPKALRRLADGRCRRPAQPRHGAHRGARGRLAPDRHRRGRRVRPGDPRLLQRRLVATHHGRGLQGALGRRVGDAASIWAGVVPPQMLVRLARRPLSTRVSIQRCRFWLPPSLRPKRKWPSAIAASPRLILKPVAKSSSPVTWA